MGKTIAVCLSLRAGCYWSITAGMGSPRDMCHPTSFRVQRLRINMVGNKTSCILHLWHQAGTCHLRWGCSWSQNLSLSICWFPFFPSPSSPLLMPCPCAKTLQHSVRQWKVPREIQAGSTFWDFLPSCDQLKILLVIRIETQEVIIAYQGFQCSCL